MKLSRSTLSRRLLAPVVFSLVLLVLPGALDPPTAEATIPVFDAGNFTQNLRTAVAQLRAIEQRLEMLRNQVDQYRWMLAQIERLDSPRYREISGLLSHIEALLSQTRGLVYTLPDTSNRFLDTFPGFEASPDLRADELDRAETTLETLRGALESTQAMGESFLPSQRELSEMKAQALASRGHLEVFEKAQALASRGHLEVFESQALLTSYLAEEVSKLLEQQAVATNAQVVYYAHELSTQVTAAETLRQAVASSRRGVGPYEATDPLPVIPPSVPRGLLGPSSGGRP